MQLTAEQQTQGIKITYQYGLNSGYFTIGQMANGKFWWWDAAGNNGKEITANKAIESARKWIKDSM